MRRPIPTDLADGDLGYLDRWVNGKKPAYGDAVVLSQTMENFGLKPITQRFDCDSLG